MQQGNFIDVFLARHVSGIYAHHREHKMLSCSMWFCAPSFGWVVVLRAVAWVVCAVRIVTCTAYGFLYSVQKTICCNSTSNVPDDGRMYPKHVELRIYQ